MHTIIEYLYDCLNLHTLCLFIGFAVGFAAGVYSDWREIRKLRRKL